MHMPHISIDDQIYTYEVLRQNRKSLRLEVSAGPKLDIKAPRGLPDAEIRRFLEKNAAWIREKATLSQQPPAALADGAQLFWLGRAVTLVLTTSLRKPFVHLTEDKLSVNCYALRPYPPELLLRQWYAQEAARLLVKKTKYWCAAMETSVNRIAIKEQKTRWGSCSAKGNVNYNWRIVMAPEEIVDYLVVHELAHRFELNHSAAFWARVARHCPDYQRRRQWLKENGGKLFQILP